MMRRGWLVALAVVVAVNLGVWVGVWRNRAGEPDATVALDEREIVLLGGADGAAPSGAQRGSAGDGSLIRLRWHIQREAWPGGDAPSFLPSFIDLPKLEALGFDCSVRPGDPAADAFYRATLPRPAVVVVEIAGPAWQRHLALWQERSRADIDRLRASRVLKGEEEADYQRAIETAPERLSRLVPIDVGTDPDALRAHYPDRTRYLLLRAVVRLYRDPGGAGTPPSLVGRIAEWLPGELIVPRQARAAVAGLPPTRLGASPGRGAPRFPDRHSAARLDHASRYQVRIKVGHLLQPWVEAISPAQ